MVEFQEESVRKKIAIQEATLAAFDRIGDVIERPEQNEINRAVWQALQELIASVQKLDRRQRCSSCGKCRAVAHVGESPIPRKPRFYLCQQCYEDSFIREYEVEE